MSADCLFVLRRVASVDKVRQALMAVANDSECGIWFHPCNSLLTFNQIHLEKNDFIFEPTDAVGSINSDLFLSHTGYCVNDQKATLSLEERLSIIQKFATISLMFCEHIELYISEDNPHLPDYSTYRITCDDIVSTLLCEYERNIIPVQIIPSVCLYISDGGDENRGDKL